MKNYGWPTGPAIIWLWLARRPFGWPRATGPPGSPTPAYMYSFTLKFWFLYFSLFGVFSLTSLCLLQHKFFPASFLTRKLSSHSFIRPAVLSLTSGYVIYIVPQLCLRMNHVILQRKRYYLVKQLVSETYKWQKCCRKSLRLIRELELVSRGFTLYVWLNSIFVIQTLFAYIYTKKSSTLHKLNNYFSAIKSIIECLS